jgi:hypothetical protein
VREIRPLGLTRRDWKRDDGGTVNPSLYRKRVNGNPPPAGRAPVIDPTVLSTMCRVSPLYSNLIYRKLESERMHALLRKHRDRRYATGAVRQLLRTSPAEFIHLTGQAKCHRCR